MAAHRQANSHYLRNKIEIASPIERIIILFEACIRFIAASRMALLKGDKVGFVEKNIRAQNILRELRNSLNLDIDEKVAGRLYTLYNYMIKQLMMSVRMKKVGPLDSVSQMVQKLCGSWKEADKQGLGQDVKRVEDRGKTQATSKVRTVTPTASYKVMSEGLNLVS